MKHTWVSLTGCADHCQHCHVRRDEAKSAHCRQVDIDAYIASLGPRCTQCSAPGVLTDKHGRPWCELCVVQSPYCVLCGRLKAECRGCTLTPLETAQTVTCGQCGVELSSDEPGCANCDLIDQAQDWQERGGNDVLPWLSL